MPATPDSPDPDGPARLHLPGLLDLRWRTAGDPRVCVAVLDGPADLTHPSLRGAALAIQPTIASERFDGGPASRHGTHVASVIFGRSPVPGVAPGCRGVLVPIFESVGETGIRPCSQLDLARALVAALQAGALVINVSGGEFTPSGQAHPLLADAVRACADAGVLVVAAAGNDGCECLHVPAALDTVLAVGAADANGDPLPFSNWGDLYETHGIVAPGQDILGAAFGGGTELQTGTSYAAAVVSGVAALLLSVQLARGESPDPRAVREALLRTALDCEYQPTADCRRLLAGRINIPGAVSYLFGESSLMSELSEAAPVAAAVLPSGGVQPSGCGCAGPSQTVYALGQLGYDLVSEARLDSLVQKMAGAAGETLAQRVSAFDPRRLLAYLDQNPWDAAAVEWTLSLDGTPVYAVRPQGAFAADTYKLLRTFLLEQLDEGAERISLPGAVSGTARLMMGQTVPVVVPEQRGMFSWSTRELVRAAVGDPPPADAGDADRQTHERKTTGVRNFLDRVYYGLRNLGALPQDRAINFAASNAFNFERVYEAAIKEQMELESINVVRSPFCRPGSDCWDVEVYFFYPDRPVQAVRKVYRFTVDVSDVVPVTVGPTRAWFTR